MPKLYKSHRIALSPTKDQEQQFIKAAGCSRFVYNWALENWKKLYEAGEKPYWMTLVYLFNSIKKEEFPWLYEVHSDLSYAAIRDVGKAFNNFFKGISKYPKFKKKNIKTSFFAGVCRPGKFQVGERKIRIPRIGWVKTRENLRWEGRVVKATVSKKADKWYVSILVEVEEPAHTTRKNHGAVGVDLGLSNFATLSTGEKLEGPKPFAKNQIKLRMLNKKLTRQVKGSKRSRKTQIKRARCYARLTDIRNDYIHKFTTKLVKKYDQIGIENLHVQGMSKNRRIAKAVMDMGFGEFSRQLGYKSVWYDSNLTIADRWYPSSKTCSSCGSVKKVFPLWTKVFECESCGVCIDRDVNAAINLKNLSVGFTETAHCLGSSGQKVCLHGETADWVGTGT